MTTTAQESAQRRVKLAPEDLARVRRLTEEVKARLYEVALIMGRTLDHPIPPGTAVQYESRTSVQEAGQTIDVVVIALPDGSFCCTQDPPGECVCPC